MQCLQNWLPLLNRMVTVVGLLREFLVAFVAQYGIVAIVRKELENPLKRWSRFRSLQVWYCQHPTIKSRQWKICLQASFSNGGQVGCEKQLNNKKEQNYSDVCDSSFYFRSNVVMTIFCIKAKSYRAKKGNSTSLLCSRIT